MKPTLRFLAVLLAGPLLWLAGSATASERESSAIAEIISVQGQAETRRGNETAWSAARVGQPLVAGQFLRTGAHSRLGLLLRDRTQLRLNENSLLQLKDVAAQTRLRLENGRAWTQTRTVPDRLYMETPSATAAIRGTDWELDVGEDGTTTLTVLSGQVEFFNDQGSLNVGTEEAAQAHPGLAPTRLQLVRPRDRVQWVTGGRPEPLRDIERPTPRPDHPIDDAFLALRAGDMEKAREQLGRIDPGDPATAELSALAKASLAILERRLSDALPGLEALIRNPDTAQPAAWLLLAGIHRQEGDTAATIAVLQQGLVRFPGHPRLMGALARAQLAADARAQSRATIEHALSVAPNAADTHLARGELARIEGDANTARSAFDRAIALAPDDDRGWYERGRVGAETGDWRGARGDLRRALAIEPGGAGYPGELGTLETGTDNFDDARQAFELALTANPDDYVALTGRGLLALRRGETETALADFLKAGVMEPRYARSRVYTGVAYYQLGLVPQALAELQRAAQLDEKDPLPHFMASLIHGDHNRPAAAIASAREAMRRMPFLKSLDQLANDQSGSANLGSAFALAGLEEWAMLYAQNSYNSLWAGSHLFLADRYPGLYTRNSALFQGFLADPTAFGGSPRRKTLLPRPGAFAGVNLGGTYSDDYQGAAPQGKTNGYVNEWLPLSWFAQISQGDFELPMAPYERLESTAALGAKPHHDLGLFLFATETQNEYHLNRYGKPAPDDLRGIQSATHTDAGLHYRFSSRSQLWLKGGRFDSDDSSVGMLDAQDMDSLVEIETPEIALRHTFAFGEHEFTWGGEQGTRRTEWNMRLPTPFFEAGDPTPYYVSLGMRQYERSRDGFLSWRWLHADRIQLQLDGSRQDHARISAYEEFIDWAPGHRFLNDEEFQDLSREKWRPRVGLWARIDERWQFRVAHQRWQRPATFSSLGPVATVGIPLDDRLVPRGGLLERTRGQIEWETTESTYLLGWADRRDIRQQAFSRSPFAINDLESLGNLRVSGTGLGDLFEFSDAPEFQAGRLQSAGLSVNHLLSEQWSLVGRYARHDSENTGNRHPGNELPYIPDWLTALGATWTSGSRWRVESGLVYRDERFADESNQSRIRPGTNGSLDVYWFSPMRRWNARLALANALDRDAHTQSTLNLIWYP